jgi:hypothetical protein
MPGTPVVACSILAILLRSGASDAAGKQWNGTRK